MVSAQSAASPAFGIIGYCRGFLRNENGPLAGRLRAYFSDRTSGPSAAPFTPHAVDDLGVAITVDPSPVSSRWNSPPTPGATPANT